MRATLARRVTVLTEEYSQAVPMIGANAVALEYTIYFIAGTLTVVVQESNDLENWDDVDSEARTSPGAYLFRVPSAGAGIAARYVRVKYVQSAGGGDKTILAAGIETSNQ